MKRLESLAAGLALACIACDAGPTVTLRLMDAPPDGVTAVHITVAAMQVHVAGLDAPDTADPNDASIDDDGRWSSLQVGRRIDLVAHQGESAADVLGQLPLPEGKITQLRLVLDTAQPEANVATLRGVDCVLDVTKVARKGIKINHPFKAFTSEAGRSYDVLMDFELDKSLKPKGDCFELEPKLKLHKVKRDGIDQSI
jgi:hypothetical protein